MNRFSVVADGKQLDTYDNISVSFNYQIEDILDITKRTTNYSKTITLPGTPFNNKFFKQIFDVNIDTITFNVKKSIPAFIQIGEQNVMTGVLQLLNIIVNQNSVDYEIVIMGQLKNILNEFGELTIRNVDLSEFNHTRSKQTIQSSWNYDIYRNGSLINNSAGGLGYVYPYIIYGNNQDIAYRMYASDLFPSVYVKTVIDKMFDLVGYTYTSKFFNGDYFRKLILPFVDDKLQLTDEQINERTVAIGVDGTQGETTNPLLYEAGVENTSVTGYRAISPVMEDTIPAWYQGKYWFSNKGFWVPLSKESGTIIDVSLQDVNNEWTFSAQTTPYTSANSVFPHTYSRYKCQKSGYYDIDLTGYLIVKYWDLGGSPNIDLQSGDLKYYVRLYRKRGNSEILLAGPPGGNELSFTPSQSFNFSPAYDNNNPLTLDVSASNVYLEENDLIYIDFGISMWQTNWAGNDSDIRCQGLVLPSKDGVPTVLKITPSNNNLVGGNSEINMNQILPDIKLKDMFLSIIKMFNLVVFDNPEIPNNLIIEPRDEFYASRQRVLDWTDKLDYNQDVKITPMSELDVKTFYYTYKEDGDFYNEQYTTEVKRIYGDYEIDVENDFSEIQNKLEVIFSPTPDGQYGIGDRVAPLFCSIEDNILKPKKLKPRILFYGGLKPTSYPILFKDTYDSATGVTINNYAYCGMWDDPYQPQHDLGFGTTNKVYWNGINYYPTNTLVEQFHKNSLLDIIDINSKLLEADFHLTPKDIADLDFRDIILIDNAYWRINKVKDYNPIGTDKTTSVVLYKINNINIFAPDRVEISLANKTCPTDVVKKFSYLGSYYVSASGQILDANCCSSLNGDFIGGKCWVRTRLEGQKGEKDGFLKTSNTVIQGGSDMTPNPQDRPETLMSGNNTINSPGIIVRGQSNYIDYNVKSVEILGDNNSIMNGSTSNQIMGNGNTITNDTTNSFIFGDNNSIEIDFLNTGSTATTLSNIFLIGNNMIASSGNTLYADNIQMSSGSTFNGIPTSLVTNPTLSDVLTNGDTMLSTQKIESYAGLATIELDKIGAEGIYGQSLDGIGGYSKLTLNKSTDATLEITDGVTDTSNMYLTPIDIGMQVIDSSTANNGSMNMNNIYTVFSQVNNTIPSVDTFALDPTNALGNKTGLFSYNSFTPTDNSQFTITPVDFTITVTNGTDNSTSLYQPINYNTSVTDGTDDSVIDINKDSINIQQNNNTNDITSTFVLDPAFLGSSDGTSLITNSISNPLEITKLLVNLNDIENIVTDGTDIGQILINKTTVSLETNDGSGYASAGFKTSPSYQFAVQVTDTTDTTTETITPTQWLAQTTDGVISKSIVMTKTDISITLDSYADDTDAGTGGLTTGMMYQTDGTGASPLNVAGIVMIKQ